MNEQGFASYGGSLQVTKMSIDEIKDEKLDTSSVLLEGLRSSLDCLVASSSTTASSLDGISEKDANLEIPPSGEEVKDLATPRTDVVSADTEIEEISRDDIDDNTNLNKLQIKDGESDIEEIPRDNIGADGKLNDLEIKDRDSFTEEIPREEGKDERIEIMKQVIDVADGAAVQLPAPEKLGLKLEWLGTSSSYIEAGVQMQLEGHLDGLITYREALMKDRNFLPYNPGVYIGLGMVDNRLGFCDVAAGEGYRALVLCQSGLGIYKRKANPSNLRRLVRDTISVGFLGKAGWVANPRGVSDANIDEQLEVLQLQAYKVILVAMIGCKTFYDGCLWVRAALKKYPSEPELLELERELKDGYSERLERLKGEDVEREDLSYLGKVGEIYQKPYPWMEKTLFHRTEEQINAINNADPTAAWQIKPVVFGPAEPKDVKEGGDVGPLGMFAKKDMEEGEIFLVDGTFAGVSNISSSKGEHCDACHAVLVAPYISPSEIFPAKCCGKVWYCSRVCHDAAMVGYHKLLCGKNMDWVYNHHIVAKTGESRSNWPPILFLRLMAIVLADKETFVHPLRHKLLSRMAANYRKLAPGDLHGVTHNWQFWENVVAPTRILMELGVDIFLEEGYFQDVIQTIFWRLENNAHSGTTTLTGKEAHMTAINGQYLFINHSCDPNVSWHGTTSFGTMDVSWLRARDGKRILRPGSSAVWCVAARAIKKGEELKISYIGNPMGQKGKKNGDRTSKRARLAKWFDYGCGCAVCEEENKEGFGETV